MQDEILKMIAILKSQKIPVSQVEYHLGFSNGLIGKAAKGKSELSASKFEKLRIFFSEATGAKEISQNKVSGEVQPIDFECRGVKDFCKRNNITTQDLIDLYERQKKEVALKTVKKEIKVKDLSNAENVPSKAMTPRELFLFKKRGF